MRDEMRSMDIHMHVLCFHHLQGVLARWGELSDYMPWVLSLVGVVREHAVVTLSYYHYVKIVCTWCDEQLRCVAFMTTTNATELRLPPSKTDSHLGNEHNKRRYRLTSCFSFRLESLRQGKVR